MPFLVGWVSFTPLNAEVALPALLKRLLSLAALVIQMEVLIVACLKATMISPSIDSVRLWRVMLDRTLLKMRPRTIELRFLLCLLRQICSEWNKRRCSFYRWSCQGLDDSTDMSMPDRKVFLRCAVFQFGWGPVCCCCFLLKWSKSHASENFSLRVWGLQEALCNVIFETECMQRCLRRQLLPLEGSELLGCCVVGDVFLLRVP